MFFLAIAVCKCYCTHGRNIRGKKSRGRKTFIQRFTQIGVTDNGASREELELGTQHHHEELGRLVVPAHSTASTRETASEAGPMLPMDDAEERETVLSEPPPAYFSAENGPAPPKYRTLV
jgi:hypothetical protein